MPTEDPLKPELQVVLGPELGSSVKAGIFLNCSDLSLALPFFLFEYYFSFWSLDQEGALTDDMVVMLHSEVFNFVCLFEFS